MKRGSNSQSPPPLTPVDIAPDQRRYLRQYRSWQRFHAGPRSSSAALLARLPDYSNCVLVAGCQRSGTTMLTRLIAHGPGFRRFELTKDDELDSALILAGLVTVPLDHRYCFQTTYLNGRYSEYCSINPSQKLIWVVRNPHSVVYSMVNNWRRFALNELYDDCGVRVTGSRRLHRSGWPWPLGPSRLEKACYAYVGKTSQIFAIRQLIPASQLLVVDYDELVRAPERELPRIFAFIGEPAYDGSSLLVRQDSLHKARRMSGRMAEQVTRIASETHRQALTLTATAPIAEAGPGGLSNGPLSDRVLPFR